MLKDFTKPSDDKHFQLECHMVQLKVKDSLCKFLCFLHEEHSWTTNIFHPSSNSNIKSFNT